MRRFVSDSIPTWRSTGTQRKTFCRRRIRVGCLIRIRSPGDHGLVRRTAVAAANRHRAVDHCEHTQGRGAVRVHVDSGHGSQRGQIAERISGVSVSPPRDDRRMQSHPDVPGIVNRTGARFSSYESLNVVQDSCSRRGPTTPIHVGHSTRESGTSTNVSLASRPRTVSDQGRNLVCQFDLREVAVPVQHLDPGRRHVRADQFQPR